MVFVCAFGHEVMPDDLAIELEDSHVSTRICPRCLVLIAVHRRYHRMNVEKVIHNMVERPLPAR